MPYIHKIATRISVVLCLLALMLPTLLQAAESAPKTVATNTEKPDIPVLNWQERSDWVNVKSDISPAAIGDGVADDTLAIQAALDSVKTGSVIYFPAGNYRITEPLFMGQKTRNIGVNLIGHGRDTRLFWDGNEGAYMLTINGQSMSRYMGLNFDGMNKASRGLYFFNVGKSAFITNLSYRDMAFRNFVDAGIYYETEMKRQSKTPAKYATAETTYENCLFENNGKGVFSNSFNDMNHTFTGCEFRDCGMGVRYGSGTYYVRDSHFERSKEADIYSVQAEHGVTIRRVTSTDSKVFIHFGSSVGTLTVENCRVKNWTNPNYALLLRGKSIMLFDNVFEGAPDSQSSVVYHRQSGTRIIANNTMQGSTNLFFQEQHRGGQLKYIPGGPPRIFPAGFGGLNNNLIELPDSASKVKPVDIPMDQSFLKTTRTLPGKIFDAKVDFGAVGDNKTDDTQAIQKTIDAARAHGDNALAYIPSGKYNITNTIHITGANYTVGGTGFASALIWKGENGGNMVEVKGPKKLVLDSLSIGQSDHDRGKGTQRRDMVQIGVNEPTSIIYDRVFMYGKYMRNDLRGLELSNLGPQEQVVLEQIAGNLMIDNCAQATILGNVSFEGTLTLQGTSKKRDGFTGFMTRLSTHVEHAMVVKNNQSVVFSDYFVEQAPNLFKFGGTPDDPAGRISMQCPKIDATGKQEQMANAQAYHIEGFTGDIYLGPSPYYVAPREMRFTLRGDAKADMYFLGNLFYLSKPVFLETTPSIKIHWLGTIIGGYENVEERKEATKTNVNPEDYGKFMPLLDDLRTLGAHDIKINFPHIAH